MKKLSILLLGLLFFIGPAISKETKNCESKLSDTEITAIAQADLEQRFGKIDYGEYIIKIYRYECNYIYRKTYLPERPGDWFEIEISPSGQIKEFIPGK